VSTDLGPLPRQHPRERVVHRARMQLTDAILTLTTGPDALTSSELLVVLGEQIARLGSICVRDERRGEG
jgi:hypothetical protein